MMPVDPEKSREAYTLEELELNKRLYGECTKANVDFAVVEDLLRQGADPLGGVGNDWELLEHVYGEIIADAQESTISANLPRLTELFLRYGMNVDSPRIPYDDENSINPLWDLTFSKDENTIVALKMLLDHGLSANSFAEFLAHSMTDFFHVECGDPENDEFWNEDCTWFYKMYLLGASYDHIFNNDEYIKEDICCSLNTNDVHMFRNWDDFEYHFDTSYCERHPELYGSIVHIFSKKTGEEVWTIGVGKSGREALARMMERQCD